MRRNRLSLRKNLHPLVWKRATHTDSLRVVNPVGALGKPELFALYLPVTNQANRQLQIAILQMFIKEKYFRRMSLTGISIFKRLHGGASPVETLLVYCQAELKLRISKQAARLTLFCVKNINFHFLD
jgi:hypothetical protein